MEITEVAARTGEGMSEGVPAPGGPQRPWRAATWALLGTLSAIALLTFRGYGLTWDEETHRVYGDAVIAWYRSGFQDRLALDFLTLFVSTGLFDVVAQLATRVSPLDVFETRHLLGAATGVVGVWATWRLGALMGGARAGFLGAVVLALTPVFHGHAFNNPKDVPLAACVALALLAILKAGRELPRVRWSRVILAGLALGAALGVRVGTIFLLGFAALHWLVPVALARGPSWRERARATAVAGGRLLAACAIAWAAMLAAWPWAQLDPLVRPFEALRYATRFPARGTMLFDGALVRATDLPWTYLPTWFAVSLPEAWFLAFACGAVALALALARPGPRRGERWREVALLAVAAALPVIAASSVRTVLYDAQRHFLFVLPPAAALCGIGLSRFLGEAAVPRWVRAPVAVAALGSLALTAVDMVRLHPYQTVYFNRLVAGGLPAAAARFETDYWGATYREGLEAVLRHYRPTGDGPVTVANCSRPILTGHWLERAPSPGFVNVARTEDPDLLLATTRWDCHKTRGTVLHTVERMGTPLMWVIERRPRGVWVK